MKKQRNLFTVLVGILMVISAPVQAHGWRGGWGWGAPFVTGAVVGAGIYAASTYPYYGYPYGYAYPAPLAVYPAATTVVSVPAVASPVPPVAQQSHTAYYCETSKQFYPSVPTCDKTWQLVNVY